MKVIGISGFARCGKDTFVSIAREILKNNGYDARRFAFADKLKIECNEMLHNYNFKCNVYTDNSEEKKLIRPLLVWWGCQRRYDSDGGMYWVNELDKQLNELKKKCEDENVDHDKIVILVSDVRFPNEGKEWIKNTWNGQVIHIRRWQYKDYRDGLGDTLQGKFFDEAPNEEERKNDPLMQEIADVKIEWESKGIPAGGSVIQDEYLRNKVLEALNSTKFFKHQTTGILS